MPLVPNFSVTQSLASPNEISVEDTSTGSDSNTTSRRIYVLLSDGEYLVEEGATTTYSDWLLANDEITLDILSRSVAPSIRVDWLDVNNSVLYTKTVPYIFTVHDDLFAYGLLQGIAADYSIVDDIPYYQKLMEFVANLDQAERAIELAGDTKAAQASLDRNYNMILNETINF